MPDNLPFPDGKEVSPEIEVETLPGNCSHPDTLEMQLNGLFRFFEVGLKWAMMYLCTVTPQKMADTPSAGEAAGN